MSKLVKGDRVQVNIADIGKWNINISDVLNNKLGIIEEVYNFSNVPITDGGIEYKRSLQDYIEFLVKFDSPAIPINGLHRNKEYNSFWFREFDLKLL